MKLRENGLTIRGLLIDWQECRWLAGELLRYAIAQEVVGLLPLILIIKAISDDICS
jgi:hypothetical protein